MILIFTIVVTVIAYVSANNYNVVRDSTEAADNVAEEFEEELLVVMGIQDQLFTVSDGFHDYLISKRNKEKNELVKQIKKVNGDFETALRAPFARKSEQRPLREASTEWDEARLLMEKLMADRTNDKLFSEETNEAVDDRIQKANVQLKALNEAVSEEIVELRDETRERERRTFILMTLFTAMGFAIIVLFSALTYRSIIAPLMNLKEAAGKISKSDYSFRIPIRKRDEIGAVSAAFNDMASSVEKANHRLEIESSRDGLTGVMNRKYFVIRLREEISRYDRYRHPFSLLLLDVDKLKRINDKFGHQSGDKALCYLAAATVKSLRPTDGIARFGGDEFAVILSETGADEALISAERIIDSTRQNKVIIDQVNSINISISIGISNFPADASSEDEIFSAADKALYEAKKAGGNRISEYGRAA